jgi:hypothetical protein
MKNWINKAQTYAQENPFEAGYILGSVVGAVACAYTFRLGTKFAIASAYRSQKKHGI